jgi:hypothetical protein
MTDYPDGAHFHYEPFAYERLKKDDSNYQLMRKNGLDQVIDLYSLELKKLEGLPEMTRVSQFEPEGDDFRLEKFLQEIKVRLETWVYIDDPSVLLSAKCAGVDRAYDELCEPVCAKLALYTQRVGSGVVANAEHWFRVRLRHLCCHLKLKLCEAEAYRETSNRRCNFVMPILERKRWTRGKLSTEAVVSKNCVYGYLDGKRKLSDDNREAVAAALGVGPEELPE